MSLARATCYSPVLRCSVQISGDLVALCRQAPTALDLNRRDCFQGQSENYRVCSQVGEHLMVSGVIYLQCQDAAPVHNIPGQISFSIELDASLRVFSDCVFAL